ncbi:MAG: carboxymuconolactone decarboxylase family protein [Gammaproteobacteria bacterium]
MSELSLRDRELVALGAAIAANCIPCLEFHIPKARDAGISDAELGEVLSLADKVRRVPAAKVYEVADELVKNEKPQTHSTSDQCAQMMGKNSLCC